MRVSLLSPLFLFAIAAVAGVALAIAVAVRAPEMAVPLVVGVIAITLIILDPRKIIYFAILLLPFHNAPALTGDLFGIPGAKILNIVLGATLVISFVERPPGQRRDNIERRALIVLMIYMALFAIEFARSIPNLPLFSSLMPEEFHNDALRYILSAFIRPALFVAPFIFILRNMLHETEGILRAISVAIFLLSAAILAAIMQDPAILGRGRNAMSDLSLQVLGMHYNRVGTIYITVGPLLVYLAMRRGAFSKVNLALAFATLLVLQSRTALLAFTIGVVITLIALRRTLVLSGLAIGGAVLLAIWQGPTTAALLSIGMGEGGGGISLDQMFMGRIDGIWGPLLHQWLSDPGLLAFGAGRYAILTTPLWLQGEIYQTTHAHNAFLDFMLDSGVFLTIALLVSIAVWIIWSWRVGRAMRDPLYWALFICPIVYLVGAFTGRQFYPAVDNIFLFPILALMLNLIRLRVAEQESAMQSADEGHALALAR